LPYSSQEVFTRESGNKGENKFKEIVEGSIDNDRWVSFVMSTLANETAIQSTPLGGFNSPSRQDNLSDEDFGLDAQDMDIAASMIASLNMAANGAGGGVKLGMGGLSFDSNTMRSLGLALNGLRIDARNLDDNVQDDDEEGEFGGSNGEPNKANKNYYDDIINSVNNSSKKDFDVNDDDIVEVLDDSSSEEYEEEEEERKDGVGKVAVQNLFNPNFADFGGAAGEEGGDGPVEAWGSLSQPPNGFDADFGDVAAIPPSAEVQQNKNEKEGEGDKKDGMKDTWADPFADFEGSSARDDFFG